MALQYVLDPASRTVTLVYDRSETSFDEWASTLDHVLADPAFQPGYGMLSDRRQAPSPPTTETVMALLRYVRSREQLWRTRWAVLVPDRATYGMVRMAQGLAHSDPIEIGVFEDLESARRWLAAPRTAL